MTAVYYVLYIVVYEVKSNAKL